MSKNCTENPLDKRGAKEISIRLFAVIQNKTIIAELFHNIA